MPRLSRILAATAVAALGGAAAYYLRERRTPEPDYRLVRQDGAFEVRDYPAMVVAEVETIGSRERALGSGFRRLANYIFAKDRAGEQIAMTAPVLQDRAGGEPAWRTRFVMPEGESEASLPEPAAGVALAAVPARRVAAIRFSGSTDDAALLRGESDLRHWMEEAGLQPIGGFEYAFYNSPFIPAPLRRNEVLVPVSAGA